MLLDTTGCDPFERAQAEHLLAVLRAADVATLSTAGTGLTIEAGGDAKLLVLAGEPIDEPVVGYGPFVMNSREQINQAIDDFNSGRFTGMH